MSWIPPGYPSLFSCDRFAGADPRLRDEPDDDEDDEEEEDENDREDEESDDGYSE